MASRFSRLATLTCRPTEDSVQSLVRLIVWITVVRPAAIIAVGAIIGAARVAAAVIIRISQRAADGETADQTCRAPAPAATAPIAAAPATAPPATMPATAAPTATEGRSGRGRRNKAKAQRRGDQSAREQFLH